MRGSNLASILLCQPSFGLISKPSANFYTVIRCLGILELPKISQLASAFYLGEIRSFVDFLNARLIAHTERRAAN
jgi:hypothetical protein